MTTNIFIIILGHVFFSSSSVSQEPNVIANKKLFIKPNTHFNEPFE